MSEDTSGPGWVTLTPNEQVVWHGHPSLRAAMGSLVGSLLLIGLGFGFAFRFDIGIVGSEIPFVEILSIGLIGVGFLGIALLVLRYRSVEYVLTTEKVYKKTGLLSRTVCTLWINQIQHTTYMQTISERLLAYGTIEIETAGGADAGFSLTHVSVPEYTTTLLTKQQSTAGPPPHDRHPRTRDNAQPRTYG